jgi:D-sedoheptulose 7-phosphate isomerase
VTPPPDERLARVDARFAETARVHDLARRVSGAAALAVVDALLAAFARARKALIFGNGGSAADALHFAAELVGRFERDRAGLPAIALPADVSSVTAIANDYGFERVFARQVEALGISGDVAIGITTSGRSANVVAGLRAARERGLTTVGFTGGDGGAVGSCVDIHVNVPHSSAARVQEAHRTLMHAVCELVENDLPRVGPPQRDSHLLAPDT